MNKFVFTTIVFRTKFSLKRDFKVSENAFNVATMRKFLTH